MKPRAPKSTVGRAAKASTKAAQRGTTLSVGQTAGVSSFFKIKDILVPTDFSKYSEKALKYASAFAKQFNAKLILVYVVEPATLTDFQAGMVGFEDEARKAAREKLTSLRDQQGKESRYIKEIKAVVGKPFQEIVSLARGLRLDMIVIATHGRTGLKHVLLGSTAEKVVRHAPCPVLVVRGEEREFV